MYMYDHPGKLSYRYQKGRRAWARFGAACGMSSSAVATVPAETGGEAAPSPEPSSSPAGDRAALHSRAQLGAQLTHAREPFVALAHIGLHALAVNVPPVFEIRRKMLLLGDLTALEAVERLGVFDFEERLHRS